VYDCCLKEVRAQAEIAKTSLDLIFPVLERHTKVVCPSCRAVCCFHARVAYDFKDLLFIHALDLEPPPHQLRSHGDEHCRYLTEVGCSLPRIIRPFVCNWYYCAPMLELHYQLPARAQRRLSSLMSTAQTHRNQMEDLFCGMVTSPEPLHRVDTENHALPNINRPPRPKLG
jgi:hypothetical protein